MENRSLRECRYNISGVLYDAPQLTLQVNGTIKKLEPIHALLLNYFIGKHGSVIGRDELCYEVWNKEFVSDNAINRAVATLRNALEDDAKSPRFIKTLHKRGYQFLADIKYGTEKTVGYEEAVAQKEELSGCSLQEQPENNEKTITEWSSEFFSSNHNSLKKLLFYTLPCRRIGIIVFFVAAILIFMINHYFVSVYNNEFTHWAYAETVDQSTTIWVVTEQNTSKLIHIDKEVIFSELSPQSDFLLLVTKDMESYCTTLFKLDNRLGAIKENVYEACSTQYSFQQSNWVNGGSVLLVLEKEIGTMLFRLKKIKGYS